MYVTLPHILLLQLLRSKCIVRGRRLPAIGNKDERIDSLYMSLASYGCFAGTWAREWWRYAVDKCIWSRYKVVHRARLTSQRRLFVCIKYFTGLPLSLTKQQGTHHQRRAFPSAALHNFCCRHHAKDRDLLMPWLRSSSEASQQHCPGL